MKQLTPEQTQPFHHWLQDNGWRQTPLFDSRNTIWHYKYEPRTTHLKIPKQPRADQIAALAITIHKVMQDLEPQQQHRCAG